MFEQENMSFEPKQPRKQERKSKVGSIVFAVILFIIGGMIGSFFSIYWIAGNPSILPDSPIRVVNYSQPDGSSTINSTEENSGNSIVLSRDPIVTVAASVSQSVVKIKILQLSNRGYVTAGSGSGFVVSEDGYIVTNNHVVEKADQLLVSFKNGEEYEAQLIGTDNVSDIALIKIDEKNLQYLKFENSENVRVGESVIAVGNPFGYEYTVTSGVVSAVQREIVIPEKSSQSNPFEGTPFDGMPFGIPNQQQAQPKANIPMVGIVQTDAAINPGNSGGPLVNMEGKVVGVNFLIDAQGQGLGFAINSNTVKKVINDLKRFGNVGWASLGVIITENSTDIAYSLKLKTDKGVVVMEVPAGNARDAGVEKNDVIYGIDGKKFYSPQELITYIRSKNPGDEIELMIDRNGKKINIITELDVLEK
ncbi:MAG: trypsin-like peptidase domain-containing protein [Caldisericia bacterium]|nr:trypsin-like peptidase domain-containing protein [Caldisericia bacterium]